MKLQKNRVRGLLGCLGCGSRFGKVAQALTKNIFVMDRLICNF
jgi:hypothetical protein